MRVYVFIKVTTRAMFQERLRTSSCTGEGAPYKKRIWSSSEVRSMERIQKGLEGTTEMGESKATRAM